MIENQGKREQKIVTIFDDIYDLPDCRSYYRAMDHAGFRTAHFAAAGFRRALAALKAARGLEAANVIDFASGYGIGAALMRFAPGLDDVLARYRDDWFDGAASDAVIAADRDWLAGQRCADSVERFAGIDIAGHALGYAHSVGIFDAVYPENLQAGDPGAALKAELGACDLIIECGSVAHMLPAALDRMLAAAARDPWVITAPIRGNDTAEAIEVMRDYGLEVAPLGGAPFRHRRFADAGEQARAIANAQARGHVTEGYESTGFFHARLLLARPAGEKAAL